MASLLTPTTFGASDDVLCPWARGEAAAAASIPRWVAEGRLTWRVLRPDEPATFAERPLAEGLAVIAALEELEARCGAEPGPRNYLIAASGTTASGAVLQGMYEVGKLKFEEPWCLVFDATPGPGPAARARAAIGQAVVEEPPATAIGDEATVASRSLLMDVLAGVGETAPAARPEFFTIVVEDPPRLLGSVGALDEAWLPWLTRTRPSELVVAPPDRAPWASAVTVIDAARGVGSEVVLAMIVGDENGAESSRVVASVGGEQAAPVAVRWDATVSALPIAVPTYR